MKKMYKIEEGRMLCGVCGGVAEYFEIDPSIVRIGWAICGFTGAGIVAYVAAAIILPRKGQD